MSHRIYRKVGFAAGVMMASVFLSRVIGLLREAVIAYVGGATAAVDAYQVSFMIPEILNHIVACGFLSVTFIPIFLSFFGGIFFLVTRQKTAFTPNLNEEKL